jgi:hypothetical protein
VRGNRRRPVPGVFPGRLFLLTIKKPSAIIRYNFSSEEEENCNAGESIQGLFFREPVVLQTGKQP